MKIFRKFHREKKIHKEKKSPRKKRWFLGKKSHRHNKQQEVTVKDFHDWKIMVEEIIQKNGKNLPEELWISFPTDYSEVNDPILGDLMEKLEEQHLNHSIRHFSYCWSRGIQDSDISMIKAAWLGLDEDLNNSLFFHKCIGFPIGIADQIQKQIQDIAGKLQKECEKEIRLAENKTCSSFLKDIYYLTQKHKLLQIDKEK